MIKKKPVKSKMKTMEDLNAFLAENERGAIDKHAVRVERRRLKKLQK